MAYIYQADVWCDVCGGSIKADIAREHPEQVPEGPDNECTYDSDDYPKYYNAEGEESDGPQNCANGQCGGSYQVDGRTVEYGTFLQNQLTSDGYQNLKEMLDGHGETLTEPAREWAEYYGFTYHHNPYEHATDWLNETLRNLASDDKSRDVPAVQTLWEMASAMASILDGDQIQDLFQSDMDADGFFKESGWYSDEMEEC